MAIPWRRSSGLDPDAREYCARSGAAERREWSDFLRGVKALGLYERMVCWSARSSQNAGAGSILYSAAGLGRYDATLVNSPVWGDGGLVFVEGNSTYAGTAFAAPGVAALTLISAYSRPGGMASNTAAALGAPIFGQAMGLQHRSGFSAYPYGVFFGNDLNGAGSPTGYMFCSVSFDSAGRYLTRDGVQVATNAQPTTLGAGPLRMGVNAQSDEYFNGTIAFTAVASGRLKTAEIATLFALYKSTLGKGLGLP